MAATEFYVNTGQRTMLDVEAQSEARFGMIIGGATNLDRHEEEYSHEPDVVAAEMCNELGGRALKLASANPDH